MVLIVSVKCTDHVCCVFGIVYGNCWDNNIITNWYL